MVGFKATFPSFVHDNSLVNLCIRNYFRMFLSVNLLPIVMIKVCSLVSDNGFSLIF